MPHGGCKEKASYVEAMQSRTELDGPAVQSEPWRVTKKPRAPGMHAPPAEFHCRQPAPCTWAEVLKPRRRAAPAGRARADSMAKAGGARSCRRRSEEETSDSNDLHSAQRPAGPEPLDLAREAQDVRLRDTKSRETGSAERVAV